MKFIPAIDIHFKKTPLVIGLAYAIISALWILITDGFLADFIKDPELLTQYQTFKGWFFVLATSVLLYFYIRRSLRKIESATTALVESENKYRTILEQAVEGIIIADIHGNIKEANSAACKILGCDSNQLYTQNIKDIIAKEDIQKEPLHYKELYQGEVVLSERHLLHTNGSYISAEISAKVISTGLIVIVFRDITKRKQIEKELRESEQEYRLLFKNNPHPMWVYNAETLEFLAVNNSAIEKYGYSQEEFLKKTLKDIRPAEEVPLLEQSVEDTSYFQKSGPWRHRIKDGTIIFVEIISNGLIFQGKKARLVLAADITEKKRALEALEENEKRYRNLFEQSPISIWEEDLSILKKHIDLLKRAGVSDFNTYLDQYPEEITNSLMGTKILDINTATLELFEAQSKDELIKSLHSDYERLLQLQRETIVAISEGRKHFDFEKEVKTLKGNLKHVSMKWTVAEGYENTYSKVFVSIMDITQRKEAENALKALNEELEQRVSVRTSLLESSNKELEAFAYSVSHDLRAPLRRIDGFLRIFKEDSNKLDEHSESLISSVIRNTHEMQDLIDSLLSFSRFAAKELSLRNTDMYEMASRISKDLIRYEENRKIDLVIDPLPTVFVDHNLIQQVWINLISNALKFTRNNSETIIRISSNSKNGFFIFKVSDNGIGFNPSYMYKLFDVFQRLHKKEDFEGTGVGLAIVKRIITRHNGKVWAESEPGKGSCFFFSIPEVS